MLLAGALLLELASAGAVRAGPVPGYYDSVNASNAEVLRASLHAVIDDHQRFPYTSTATDTWDILEQADENSGNTAEILDVYLNASFPKFGGGGGGYNREHTWPSSYGFPTDGSQNYPYSDCHQLFLSDESYNSSRSNKLYGQCDASCAERVTVANGGVGGGSGVYPGQSNWTTTGIWETWAERQGDVARALFYMDVRYAGGTHGGTGASEPDLILTDDETLVATTGTNASVAYMGFLSTLLTWHAGDPVDAREQWRNDVIDDYQGNRNPFIDHPDWVACLYADVCSGGGVPTAPSGLQALSTAESVELDWNDNFEPDLAGYRVMRALAPGGPYVALQLGLLTSSQFTDVSVNSGSFYYYVVTAVDLDGDESVLSAELAVPVGVSPWINEIHYDNSGADADEGVEIAGLAGIDLTGWQLVTYNGNGGGVTTTLALSGVLADDGSGFGFLFFPLASLQNGPADGLALVDPGGVVVEFLSYEGVVVAVGGAANGMTSTDIGVSESSSTMLGDSLQLQGQGSQAADFSWAAPGPHTRGAVNTGQELFKSVSAVPTLSHGALIACVAAMLASGLWMALRPVRSRIRAKD
jgi:endonuclease I